MASLVGQQLKDTYDSLLKTSDNDALVSGSYKEITDGSGNGSNLYLGQDGNVGIGTSPNTDLHIRDSATENPTLIKLEGLNNGRGGTIGTTSQDGANDVALKFNSLFTGVTFGGHVFSVNDTEAMRIDGIGDISFRDTSTNEAFYWDASTARLGLGTTSPVRTLHIDGGSISSDTPTLRISSTDSSGTNKFGIEFFSNSGSDVRGKLLADNNGKVYLDDNGGGGVILQGNGGTGGVGIGTAPSYPLEVDTGAGTFSVRAKGGSSVTIASDASLTYFGDTHEFSNSAGTSEFMRIDSSGNVGIGTTDTSGLKTLIKGATGYPATSGTTQTGVLRISGGTGLYNVLDMGVNESTDVAWMQATRANSLAVYDKLAINPYGGNVGIGTTSPTEKLEVGGNAILDATNANLKIKAGVTGTKGDIQWTFNTDSTVYASVGIEYDNRGSDGFLIDSGYPITMDFAGNYMRWQYNGTEKMRLDSSGNLGIGASTIDDKLHVVGTSTKIQELGQTGITMKFNHGNNASVNSDINIANIKSFVSSGSSGSEGGGLTFETKPTAGSATERMRIDSSGRLLVGTETALAGFSGTAQRACFSATGDTMTVEVGTGTGAYTGIHIDRTSSDGKAISFERGDTDVGSISITTTATAYNTSSDYRLKENVVELTGALDRVAQLKPSRFNFIADADKTVDGFLAHEVANVVPEAISGEKDAVDEEGNPIYQGIDQSKLVPLLVGAIKELRAEIEQLKNQ